MTVITFNIPLFRQQFPEFESSTTYKDASLQAYFDASTGYVSDVDYGFLNGDSRIRALNLMTAHLVSLSTNGGGSGGIVTSSTIDKVSVTVSPPPFKNQWQYWLALTPYGLQLWALLSQKGNGGLYIGGSRERSAFRRAFGNFS